MFVAFIAVGVIAAGIMIHTEHPERSRTIDLVRKVPCTEPTSSEEIRILALFLAPISLCSTLRDRSRSHAPPALPHRLDPNRRSAGRRIWADGNGGRDVTLASPCQP
jgi:hypothetical protein